MNCSFFNVDLFLKCIKYDSGLGCITNFDTSVTYSDVTACLFADDVTSIHLVIKDDRDNIICGDIIKIDNNFYVSYHCSDEIVVINSVPDTFYIFTLKLLMRYMSDLYRLSCT